METLLHKEKLVEILDRQPDAGEAVDDLIVEALHILWHAAPRGRGWGRPCEADHA